MSEKRPGFFGIGLGTVQICFAVFVVLVLFSLMIPSVSSCCGPAILAQAISNARQINIATTGAAEDGFATENKSIGWPADIEPKIRDAGGFVKMLIDGGYLKYGDLKVLGAGSMVTKFSQDHFDASTECGFKIYRVGKTDESDTVFLNTKNVTLRGAQMDEDPEYEGQFKGKARDGFVVFRKGGDGTYYLKRRTTPQYGSMPKAGPAPLLQTGIVAAPKKQ